MRLSLPTLLTVAISLVSIVNAHQDHTLADRDYVDELIAREESYNAPERRELFADISTRELIDELSDRLERRRMDYKCEYCNKQYSTRRAGEKESNCTKSPANKNHKIVLLRPL